MCGAAHTTSSHTALVNLAVGDHDIELAELHFGLFVCFICTGQHDSSLCD